MMMLTVQDLREILAEYDDDEVVIIKAEGREIALEGLLYHDWVGPILGGKTLSKLAATKE